MDALLPRLVPGLSRAAAQRLLEEGLITVDGAPVKKNARPDTGSRLLVRLPEPEAAAPEPEDLPLDIVYEDGDLIAVNKARGMVVHPAPGHSGGTLVNALLWRCGDSLSGIGGILRPGIVHRIDKDTSGLIIAAKNDFAHRALSEQLRDHSLARTYEAVVYGRVKDDSGIVDAPIGRHPTDRKRMAILQTGRHAITHYEVLARYRGFSHLRCQLETGRTHQIRVHMESIGHPLLGDMLYGKKCPAKGLEGQCLHARALRFIHPRTGEEMLLETPLPDYFVRVLASLGEPE